MTAAGALVDGDLSRLAEEVGETLRRRGETVALAESCTGGLIAAALTATAGSSDYLWGGAVVYSVAAKATLAGLDNNFLRANGTVSAPTTEALACGIRERSDATYGLAVTGWAGPSAEPAEALGTVFVAYSKAPQVVEARRHQFDGSRGEVRNAAAAAALGWLRDILLGAEDRSA